VDESRLDWRAFLGNAPDQPFDAYRFRHWRWFWDFGNGILTDLMVHFIDVVHWYFDLEHPLKATTVGDNYISRGVWQTPDTIQTLLVDPNEMQVYFEGTFCNARNGAMLEFMGTDATLYLDRGRYELHPERGRGRYQEMVLGHGNRGRDFYDIPDGELLHLTNWVECIGSRNRPNAPAEAGVSAAAAAHLGNRALREDRVAVWGQ
jgi:predicted dehydrogenase